MTIYDIFSKRQKRLLGDVPDVYMYEDIPETLRVQIVHIWNDALGDSSKRQKATVRTTYELIVNTLCREYGLFELPYNKKYIGGSRDFICELIDFFLEVEEIEKALDAIELSFRVINGSTQEYSYLLRHNASDIAEKAIFELNTRFKEHGIGFQFINNEIIRVDSELIHAKAVKPALRLMNNKSYHGAQQEFLSAYEHYRHGRNKEAMNDCLKSFESTMKAICDKRKWTCQPNPTANTLIKVCFDNDLVPSFWQSQFTSLRNMLASSIPTCRNKLSGHGQGQGSNPEVVPDYLVAYMLHMTASTLVFLTKAEEKLA